MSKEYNPFDAPEVSFTRDALRLVDDMIEGRNPPRGKPPRWIWVASPYGDAPEERTKAIREWCADVFATLNPNTILPIPIVGRSGDWGARLWGEDEWYRVLEWDIYSRDWSGVICVERLLGELDFTQSKGVMMERRIAQERGLPVVTIDACDLFSAQRKKISDWLGFHFAPPWNPKEGWFEGVE